MKKVISKTTHMNKKGWLLTAKEVEDTVSEKLGFKTEHINMIHSYRHNVVTVSYTEEPLLVKKENFFYEQDVKDKRVHIKKDEFLGWFGIKTPEKGYIQVETRLRFQGVFIEQYNNPDKDFVSEEDSFYLFAISDFFHEDIEEIADDPEATINSETSKNEN